MWSIINQFQRYKEIGTSIKAADLYNKQKKKSARRTDYFWKGEYGVFDQNSKEKKKQILTKVGTEYRINSEISKKNFEERRKGKNQPGDNKDNNFPGKATQINTNGRRREKSESLT